MYGSGRAKALLVLMLFGVCSLAVARDLGPDEALRLRQKGIILPFEQFVDRALERYPASRLLEVELEKKHGRYVFEVELLTKEGVVRELKFDAREGELFEDKEDD